MLCIELSPKGVTLCATCVQVFFYGGFMDPLFSLGGAAVGGLTSIFGGRRQQSAANASNAAQMKYERENMQYQNQVALDMSREAQAFNSAEAVKSRDWSAGQAQEARDWNATQSGIERTFNAAEAERNRAYQREMSNTQYQRATRDMQAAGLNPMLAYSQGGAGNVSGSTASTSAPQTSAPSGASASGPSASPSGLARGGQAQQFNYLASAVASAAQVGSMVAQVDNVNAATERTRAETRVMDELFSKGRTHVDKDSGAVRVEGPGAFYRAQVEKLFKELGIMDSEAAIKDNQAKASKEAPGQAVASRRSTEQDVSIKESQVQFEQLLRSLLPGGSSSAKGIGDIFKGIVPLLYHIFKGK